MDSLCDKTLCDRYEEMMFDFIDSELSDSKRVEFDTHLRICRFCRTELKKRIKTIKLISESAHLPKSDLRTSIIEKLRHQKNTTKRFRYFSTIAACVVLIAVITNFAFIYMSQNNIKATQDENLTIGASDIVATDKNTESVFTKNDTDSNKNDMAPKMSSPGIMAETELRGDAYKDKDDVLIYSEEKSITQSSIPDMFNDNIQLYAPDYSGNINMIIISEEAASVDAVLIKDASNYKVYIYEYTVELSNHIKQTADDNGSTVYVADEPNGAYILYIYLTQS